MIADTVQIAANDRMVIAAMLCGCVIDDLLCAADQVTLLLQEPRQGTCTLLCEAAAFLNPAHAYANLPALPRWKRTIDWVDLLDDAVFYLCFQDGSTLALRAQSAVFAPATMTEVCVFNEQG